jgi:uncharacterized protein (TIGR03067 family)
MKEPESDRAKLQGKWKVESIRLGDKNILTAVVGRDGTVEVEFKDERVTVFVGNGDRVQSFTMIAKYGTAESRQLKITDVQTKDPDGKPADNAAQKEEAFGYAFDGEKVLLGLRSGEKGVADPLKPGRSDYVIVLTRTKGK